MDTETLIMLVLALLVAAYLRGDGSWLSGLQAGATSLWRLLPILLISFAVTWLMQVLIPRVQLMRRLQSDAGLQALLTSCFTGTLVPGPPHTM